MFDWIVRRFRKQGGFYCRACGYTSPYLTPEGPLGLVFCPECRNEGMVFHENRKPYLVTCPVDGCLMKSWQDGKADTLALQHTRHTPGAREPSTQETA